MQENPNSEKDIKTEVHDLKKLVEKQGVDLDAKRTVYFGAKRSESVEQLERSNESMRLTLLAETKNLRKKAEEYCLNKKEYGPDMQKALKDLRHIEFVIDIENAPSYYNNIPPYSGGKEPINLKSEEYYEAERIGEEEGGKERLGGISEKNRAVVKALQKYLPERYSIPNVWSGGAVETDWTILDDTLRVDGQGVPGVEGEKGVVGSVRFQVFDGKIATTVDIYGKRSFILGENENVEDFAKRVWPSVAGQRASEKFEKIKNIFK